MKMRLMNWAMKIIFILIITVLLNGPKKIANLLPENLLRIHIESEANMRIFTIEEIKSLK